MFDKVDILGQVYKNRSHIRASTADGYKVGQVDFFFRHTALLVNKGVTEKRIHTFAFSKFFRDEDNDKFRSFAKVGAKIVDTSFEELSYKSFLPIHAILTPIVLFDWLKLEEKTVIYSTLIKKIHY